MNTTLLIFTTILSTLLVGTLVKGIQNVMWEKCHKPLFLWAGKHLGVRYQTWVDGIYQLISTRPPGMPRMSLDVFLIASGLVYGINHLVWPQIWPVIYRESGFKDSLDEAITEAQATALFHEKIYYYSYCVITAFAALSLLGLMFAGLFHLLIRYRISDFDFLMRIARPLLTNEDALTYEARFASMLSQADYKKLISELKDIIDNPELSNSFYVRRARGKKYGSRRA